MQRRSHLKWLLRGAVCLAVCLLCAFSAGAVGAAKTDGLLAKVKVPQVLGDGKFEYGGTTFSHLMIPRYVIEQYENSAYAIYPGESDERVREVKLALYSNDLYPNNEYVTYTQVRPMGDSSGSKSMVGAYFDDHLATLLKTIYIFCGLEDKEPCIDELTCYILESFPNTSEGIRHDIERAYKYALIQNNTQGTLNYADGSTNPLYFFAQTDPDWANDDFSYEDNGQTLRDRGCGCACAAMIFSTYHKVEITPWRTKDLAADEWIDEQGLKEEYFGDVAEYYHWQETKRYGTYLPSPVILRKSDGQVDMDTLADQIGNQGYMAVIRVLPGAFTSQEHYMVLADYQMIDGVGYFLVADPYVMKSRYPNTSQIRETEYNNDGLLYVTGDLLYRDCKSIILFEQDRNVFDLRCETSSPESGWLN